ncbi:MAG: TrgA family protein [Pseudomonadota bacterium]
MTGGKLAAALLLAAAMVMAVITFMDQIETPDPDRVLPILGAAFVGFYAGWTQLGRNLGGEFIQSAIFGVGAGAVAVVFFAFLYGVRSAYITHTGVQFPTAIDAVTHLLDAGLNVVISAVLSTPTLLALIIGSFVAGMLAEFFNRLWK